jgi:dTDP-4-dehydrorhamnose 3,5-epimerase
MKKRSRSVELGTCTQNTIKHIKRYLSPMAVETTRIDGVFVISSEEHHDSRGFFRQSYQVPELMLALGRPIQFLQGNHSRSHAGVLRGFHTEPWDKCVYVVRGTAICVVADIRPHSKTFGQSLMFFGRSAGKAHQAFCSPGTLQCILLRDRRRLC